MSGADAPGIAVELIGMADIVLVTVQFIGTRVGFHQQAVGQAGLAEHAAIGFAFGVGTDMATGRARIHPVAVDPPGGGFFRSVTRLEFEGTRGPGYTFGSGRGGVAGGGIGDRRGQRQGNPKGQDQSGETRDKDRLQIVGSLC